MESSRSSAQLAVPRTMQAVLQRAYGSVEVLEVGRATVPSPGPDQVLVRVHATSVHPDVWHVVAGRPGVLRYMGAGRARPKCPIPGTDLSGVVVAVGAEVTRFSPGDEVFGETSLGMQWKNGAAYAEYATAPQASLAHKPSRVSFEQAASVPTSGYIAYLNLAGGRLVEPRSRVLINGAGGGVGCIALQLCKAWGAEVTAVDHGGKEEFLRQLGADHFVDHMRDDFTRQNVRYDLIFDVPGNHPFRSCQRALRPRGKYVLIGHEHFGAAKTGFFGLIPKMLGLMVRALFSKQLLRPSVSMPSKQDCMEALALMMAEEKLTPPVHRSYALSDVKSAFVEMMDGDLRGKVVLVPPLSAMDG